MVIKWKGSVDSPARTYTDNSYYSNYSGVAGGANVWVYYG